MDCQLPLFKLFLGIAKVNFVVSEQLRMFNEFRMTTATNVYLSYHYSSVLALHNCQQPLWKSNLNCYYYHYDRHQVHEVKDAAQLYSDLMDLIVQFANNGVIHSDFNEFNIMVTDEDKPIIIDFPQMVSTSHENAKM